MHTSRSGLEMWKQRRCTGNADKGARQQAGNSSQVWAVLGTSGKDVAAHLGDLHCPSCRTKHRHCKQRQG